MSVCVLCVCVSSVLCVCVLLCVCVPSVSVCVSSVYVCVSYSIIMGTCALICVELCPLAAVLSGAMASLINFAMWLLPLEHGLYLMLSCVSSAIMMVTINSLGVMSTNLYPTSIRWVGKRN